MLLLGEGAVIYRQDFFLIFWLSDIRSFWSPSVRCALISIVPRSVTNWTTSTVIITYTSIDLIHNENITARRCSLLLCNVNFRFDIFFFFVEGTNKILSISRSIFTFIILLFYTVYRITWWTLLMRLLHVHEQNQTFWWVH